MKSVSRYESNLLTLLRCLFGRVPLEQGLAALAKPAPRPRCLSADAVALVEDTLAKGMVGWLGRLGMPRQRHLRAGAGADGRLWQRTPPEDLGLAFSPLSLEFLLQWLSNDWRPVKPETEPTLGDRLLFCLALDRFRDLDVGRFLAEKWPPLHRDGLCRLMFLDELRDSNQQQSTIQWHLWTNGIGACVMETMQEALAQRWVRLERDKEQRTDARAMQALGAGQQRVLGEYLEALAAADRRDLARCFLMAGQQLLLREAPTARHWIGKLQLQGQRLADRVQIYRAALAFLVQFERLRQWEHDCRSVGYFDEGYAASQLWKADWERFQASASCERAAAILHEVAPLRA